MTDATIGYGTQIRIGRGAGPTWTTLAEVGDVTWPVNETDSIEATHMASPSRAKEYIAGLTDNGEIAVPMNWVPGSASDVTLEAIRLSGEIVQIEISSNEDVPTVRTYAGFCKKYGITSPVQGVQTAEAMFQVNGEIVA